MLCLASNGGDWQVIRSRPPANCEDHDEREVLLHEKFFEELARTRLLRVSK